MKKPKKRHYYQVLVKAFAGCVVLAENEEEARQIVSGDIRLGDLEHDETRVEKKLTKVADIRDALRHSGFVPFELEDAKKEANGNPFGKTMPVPRE